MAKEVESMEGKNLSRRTVNQFARICKDLTSFAYRLRQQDETARVAIMKDNLILVKDDVILHCVYLGEYLEQKDQTYSDETNEVLYLTLINNIKNIEKNKEFTVKNVLKEHWENLIPNARRSISNKFSKDVKDGKIEGVSLKGKKGSSNSYIKA